MSWELRKKAQALLAVEHGGIVKDWGGQISVALVSPHTDLQLVGFSVTYAGDYSNVLRLLSMAGIPLRPEARRPQAPLILMGGVCAFANPEPIAPFMDFVV